MTNLQPGSDAWLAQVREEPIEPEQPIIDPHHHLWKNRFGRDYLLPEFHGDTGGGHNIVKSVFMECRAFWLREGPEHLRPTGETRHIADLARRSESGPNEKAPRIAGIVAHADLRLAATAKLGELLDAHEAVCGGRLRGIRQCAALDRAAPLFIDVQAPAGLYADADFRAGLRMLAARNLTFDAWHYHHQMRDFIDLAQALPECTFVLDHFGTPLGVGPWRLEAVYPQWRRDLAALARCENVYAKLGGLAMPDNGFGWHEAARPPDSDEFVAAQKRWYLHAIDCFGPERCMFESNFPVDRLSIGYTVLWNGFKKLAADFSEAEKQALFHGTAARVYRLRGESSAQADC